MDSLVVKSLEEFIDKANSILNNGILAAYCYGSLVYDDFCIGYSDLDFFIVAENALTEE